MNLVYWSGYSLSKVLAKAFFDYRIIHPERMVETGSLILAVNHTSYFDPPLAGICSQRPVYYLARKSLLEWPVLGPLFPQMNVIPVERDGNDRSALRLVIKTLKEGNGVVLFPEGTRSKDGNLQPARAGIGLVIAKTLAPVLPMRIFGAHEAFPKNSKLPRRHPIRIVLGHPLYFTEADLEQGGRDVYQHLSDRVMRAISELELPDDA